MEAMIGRPNDKGNEGLSEFDFMERPLSVPKSQAVFHVPKQPCSQDSICERPEAMGGT